MVVITIKRDPFREIVVKLHTIDQQLDVIPVVCVHSKDDCAGLTVCLEEVVFTDVHDGVTNFGIGNIVKCAVTIGVDVFVRGTVRHRSVVARVVV